MTSIRRGFDALGHSTYAMHVLVPLGSRRVGDHRQVGNGVAFRHTEVLHPAPTLLSFGLAHRVPISIPCPRCCPYYRHPTLARLRCLSHLLLGARCRPDSPRSLLGYGVVRLLHPLLHPIPASASCLASFPLLLSSLLRSRKVLSACECVVALGRQ